ncbi:MULTISPECIES: helix-turn-helix domain-containing protein [unclassified Myxococcus]|uniref:helix-turn-helix domain-containing protein n=1 Tax=unclassified Myxococcus TaxID=2648731 RepID=UPI00157A4D1F|nr:MULTISPECIES: helix-turn-helix domain-containing protein [unclassified Myxococcus]NTX00830.1 helix-turn-helix domain-containing protein [Myxococcus sp. CA040A]NTX12464.1 helix-turn-helix domain-containing protein [Myxococcus sp. CA056]NTX33483.1 helix-turn-helix domain-containing protein [Myxococcus sp. CA033]NTX58142.1 helix-turn-helix domain-containing protein [Myxococcus sp. CA039A]
MRTVFSTDAVSERERHEYWQEMASKVLLGLRTERKTSSPFFGRLDHHEAGPLGVTYLHSSAQSVHRGETEISRAPRECYFLCMQVSGVCRLRQGREERISHPGDVELFDGTRPGELSFDAEYRRIVIVAPYATLRPRLSHPDEMVGSVLHTREGVGALVSAYLRAFAETQVAEPVAGSVSDNLLELLALAFNTQGRDIQTNAASVREARRHALRVYVEHHLAEPSLSPATVAARFRMSTRYLHGLFAESGESFMRWVLSRRLARCRKALEDPEMDARSIADIAFSWGFMDLTHFGRAFKKAYGRTPRDWRYEQARQRS